MGRRRSMCLRAGDAPPAPRPRLTRDDYVCSLTMLSRRVCRHPARVIQCRHHSVRGRTSKVSDKLTCINQHKYSIKSEAQASEVSSVRARRRGRIFEILKS
eukprot:scaffold17546_cov69-Phaeocystis_antarctica.AAC.6